jgi:diadenosine tetraphosphate (Ap4A) HIT family hydrolase
LCGDLNSLELVFEDDRVAVVLHEDWAVRGHAMVVWKEHVENVADLSDDEWLRLSNVYRRTERALLDVTQADRAIIMKLGIAVPHLHIHIYPVSAALSRAEVFSVIEGRDTEPRDERFVEALRTRLDRALSAE